MEQNSFSLLLVFQLVSLSVIRSTRTCGLIPLNSIKKYKSSSDDHK